MRRVSNREACSPLGEDIGELVLRRNMLELNNFVFDKTSNKVMSNVDVLGA